MQSGYTKHDKHDSKDPRQTLSMLKHDQELHKAKPKHAIMVVQMQDACYDNKGDYKASA